MPQIRCSQREHCGVSSSSVQGEQGLRHLPKSVAAEDMCGQLGVGAHVGAGGAQMGIPGSWGKLT